MSDSITTADLDFPNLAIFQGEPVKDSIEFLGPWGDTVTGQAWIEDGTVWITVATKAGWMTTKRAHELLQSAIEGTLGDLAKPRVRSAFAERVNKGIECGELTWSEAPLH